MKHKSSRGAGKATAIKLLVGLSRPTGGKATLFGMDSVHDSLAVRSRVGYLAKDPRFYTHLTAQRHKSHQKRWKRFEKPQPGHQVQVDVKFITPIGAAGKKYYQFTAIDDCTRIRVLRIYPRCNQNTAIQFLDYLLAKLPFRVEKIQTDNGAEFATQFHYHLLDRGISQVYIKPATPRLNGKVERSTASTPKSSTGCSTESSSTPPSSSTTSSKNGRTSTTTTDPTTASPVKPPTKD